VKSPRMKIATYTGRASQAMADLLKAAAQSMAVADQLVTVLVARVKVRDVQSGSAGGRYAAPIED
jgi:hypothetical protein